MINLVNTASSKLVLSSTPEMAFYQSQFETSMAKAEEFFTQLPKGEENTKKELNEHLQSAWSSLVSMNKISGHPQNPAHRQEMARVTYLWGRCNWCVVDMEVVKQAYSLSLALARQNQLTPDVNEENLSLLMDKLSSDKNNFYLIENQFTFKSETDAIIEEALASTPAVALAIADAAREMFGTYQNHADYQPSREKDAAIKEMKIQRCENALTIPHTIWTRLDTLETKWRLMDSRYNTENFVFSLRKSDDNAQMNIYKNILADLEDLEVKGNTTDALYKLKSQCHNMISNYSSGLNLHAEAYKHAMLAHEISSAHDGIDLFLKRMFLGNHAAKSFECLEKKIDMTAYGNLDRAQVKALFEEVKAKSYAQENPHPYDSLFRLNYAKFAKFEGNLDLARELANKALEVCAIHASSTSSIKVRINTFLDELKG